jgi:hypothetical protein
MRVLKKYSEYIRIILHCFDFFSKTLISKEDTTRKHGILFLNPELEIYTKEDFVENTYFPGVHIYLNY